MTDDGVEAIWFLTGMTGAGKRTALDALNRAGVECVDNLPVDLSDGFVALPRTRPVVAVIDARQGAALSRFVRAPSGSRVVYLDCEDDVLTRRLADTTRPHPCAAAGNVAAQIAAERVLLEPMRAAADVVIDTTALTPDDLVARLRDALDLRAPDENQRFRLVVSSFGFKYGPQTEADWVVDVRFLPNPFWIPDLRPQTGLDDAVRDYVLKAPETGEFLDRFSGLTQWVLEHSTQRHRTALHIAVGCTGGRHRSVAVAEALAERLRAGDVDVVTRHRDVARPDPRDR